MFLQQSYCLKPSSVLAQILEFPRDHASQFMFFRFLQKIIDFLRPEPVAETVKCNFLLENFVFLQIPKALQLSKRRENVINIQFSARKECNSTYTEGLELDNLALKIRNKT